VDSKAEYSAYSLAHVARKKYEKEETKKNKQTPVPTYCSLQVQDP